MFLDSYPNFCEKFEKIEKMDKIAKFQLKLSKVQFSIDSTLINFENSENPIGKPNS